MDQEDKEVCVLKELEICMEELMRAHLRHEKEGNEERSRMALAQIFLCNEILQLYQQNTDWEDFTERLEDYAYTEMDRYQTARSNGQRGSARVMLARVRCTRRLLTRLNNPSRQEIHAKMGFFPSRSLCETVLSQADLPDKFKEAHQKTQLYEHVEKFQQGEDIRSINREQKRLEYEARRLQQEVTEKSRNLPPGNQAYERFVEAQGHLFPAIEQNIAEPKLWHKFREFLCELIERSELRYRVARELDDYEEALQELGRMRSAGWLLRRIREPLHRREINRQIGLALTIH
ncbi:hypothetical protein GMLC_09630 [Geomonas limicola]|uniref:Uncharacterized protein n=1 Tax=Geomonas limicola TaxID=2740186 RepID=A0A6V8N629_9BACT|nr:hypothetical protein [Geomonas limicola]GFO67384.1 hypothetical protein GMLC_09630 [Geomonas limicola]